MQETAITHVALTAGIAGILSLFPAHKRPSTASKDTVASCLGLEQPVGLALALAAIWSGALRRLLRSRSRDSATDALHPHLFQAPASGRSALPAGGTASETRSSRVRSPPDSRDDLIQALTRPYADLDPKTSPAVQMTSLLLPGADKPTIAFLCVCLDS